MKLFLQIELIPWKEAGYQKPLVTFASGLSDDVIGAELDNQSDGAIADLVIRLCDQAESVFVLIQAQPEESLGVTLKLIHHLLRKEEKIYQVILAGNHISLERLLNPLAEKFVKETETEKLKTAIRLFAQLNPDR
ncbi:MAG TPA: hypothetical protein PLM56_14095 [Cyclobacteriaceae bacterium]|jgi:hypothetical protein|nr:hypothetical protein [Cyclobacteriaceae bacterium]HRE67832.1 hypothetical protein [Cyclobacteriaceae bacterium]HRF34633.1 hypothetical protein [Cyclobacteriaceae bacterium]